MKINSAIDGRVDGLLEFIRDTVQEDISTPDFIDDAETKDIPTEEVYELMIKLIKERL